MIHLVLLFHQGILYWIDTSYRRVYSFTTEDPAARVLTLTPYLGYAPYYLQVVSRERQPLGELHNTAPWSVASCMYVVCICVRVCHCSGDNPCEESNCTSICLLTATSPTLYDCTCQLVMYLKLTRQNALVSRKDEYSSCKLMH